MSTRINPGYFDRLGRSAPIVRTLVDIGEDVARAARASAPVDTGEYRDSIDVEVGDSAHRAVVRVVARDSKATIIEAKHGTLARALSSARVR